MPSRTRTTDAAASVSAMGSVSDMRPAYGDALAGPGRRRAALLLQHGPSRVLRGYLTSAGSSADSSDASAPAASSTAASASVTTSSGVSSTTGSSAGASSATGAAAGLAARFFGVTGSSTSSMTAMGA